MPIHASPGVYFETIDFSLYASNLSKSILALVGKTRKGPTEPTFVLSVRQFVDLFGTPRVGEFSSLAAVSFLEFGSALWFSRILGPAARKATVDIPKAVEITDELLTVVEDKNEYIFKATLNHAPVPGTVEIKLIDPDNPDNYAVIRDNGNGSFPATINQNISSYPNFIDYDTGEYRFTLTAANTGAEVALKYNTQIKSVSNEVTLTVDQVDADAKYSGMLAHSNLVNLDNFKLKIASQDHVYTFTAVTPPTDNVYELIGKDELGDTVGSGSLNIITGQWEVEFSDTNIEVGDKFIASYDYCIYKIKVLGTVGQTSEFGYTIDKSFIGSLNTVVYPNTVSILVNDVVVSTDNGEGKFVQGVVTSDNKIDYETGAIDIALIQPPKKGTKLIANYLAKHLDVLKTVEAGGESSGSLSSKLSIYPVIKNSIIVKIGPNLILTDDGEGNLIGKNGNGTIDYATGNISINYVANLVEGDTITAEYLSKMGTASSPYKGEYYNGTKIRFIRDDFGNYEIDVWSPEANVNQLPTERVKNIEFSDPSSKNFISNKFASNYVEIQLDNIEVGDIPVLNTILELNGGYDDFENITEHSAISSLSEFANAEKYDINLIACPDFAGNRAVINKLINLCENERGDCFAIIDPPQGLTPQDVVNWHNGAGKWLNENALNSSFAALYYPWIQISDEFTESLQWVPPSVRIVAVYAYNDRIAEVWNAPAGLNRGRLFRVQKVERQLNVSDRDLLYATGTNAINPICDFVGDGIVVYGQKTLQRKPSALDRVNVMRLIIYITKILATATKYLLFEPNDRLTWTLYTQLVNPLLSDIKQRRGLYEFKVVCDETTNTPYNIDNNTMIAEVWLKPTKVAERLINRFVITSSGATFSELEVQ